MRAAPLFLSALIAVSAAVPAHAQSRQELDQRLRAIEERLRASPGEDAAMRSLNRINELENQIRSLTGQVEELQFRNRQLETRLQTLQEDMISAMGGGGGFYDEFAEPGDAPRAPGAGAGGPTRLGPGGGGDFAIVDPDDRFAAQRRAATGQLGATVERPDAVGAPPTLGDGGPIAPQGGLEVEYSRTGADPDLLFQRGRTRLFDGDFSAALAAFAEFIDVAPQDPRAGEAWFWVGSIYRTEDQPVEAADALVRSLQLDSDGPMAPEAMVQLGASLAGMGQRDQACQTLDTALSRYPDMDPSVRNTATRERRAAGC